MMRTKFKIFVDGVEYKPPEKCFVVMNSSGVFFLYNSESYYPSLTKLSFYLPKYDVKWRLTYDTR